VVVKNATQNIIVGPETEMEKRKGGGGVLVGGRWYIKGEQVGF